MPSDPNPHPPPPPPSSPTPPHDAHHPHPHPVVCEADAALFHKAVDLFHQCRTLNNTITTPHDDTPPSHLSFLHSLSTDVIFLLRQLSSIRVYIQKGSLPLAAPAKSAVLADLTLIQTALHSIPDPSPSSKRLSLNFFRGRAARTRSKRMLREACERARLCAARLEMMRINEHTSSTGGVMGGTGDSNEKEAQAEGQGKGEKLWKQHVNNNENNNNNNGRRLSKRFTFRRTETDGTGHSMLRKSKSSRKSLALRQSSVHGNPSTTNAAAQTANGARNSTSPGIITPSVSVKFPRNSTWHEPNRSSDDDDDHDNVDAVAVDQLRQRPAPPDCKVPTHLLQQHQSSSSAGTAKTEPRSEELTVEVGATQVIPRMKPMSIAPTTTTTTTTSNPSPSGKSRQPQQLEPEPTITPSTPTAPAPTEGSNTKSSKSKLRTRVRRRKLHSRTHTENIDHVSDTTTAVPPPAPTPHLEGATSNDNVPSPSSPTKPTSINTSSPSRSRTASKDGLFKPRFSSLRPSSPPSSAPSPMIASPVAASPLRSPSPQQRKSPLPGPSPSSGLHHQHQRTRPSSTSADLAPHRPLSPSKHGERVSSDSLQGRRRDGGGQRHSGNRPLTKPMPLPSQTFTTPSLSSSIRSPHTSSSRINTSGSSSVSLPRASTSSSSTSMSMSNPSRKSASNNNNTSSRADAGTVSENDTAPKTPTVKRNVWRAASMYKKGADAGDVRAMCDLGTCYQNGVGVDRDVATAVRLFEKASKLSYPRGQFCLARCYAFGEGVPRDTIKAVTLYRQAADNGHAAAMCNLGVCLQKGIGVPHADPCAAVSLYKRAGEAGYARAWYNLGVCYESGCGVSTKNVTKAVTLYKKAAKGGFSSAMCTLGACYESGTGVERDIAKAVAWYKKASKQGCMKAHYLLALCYHRGVVQHGDGNGGKDQAILAASDREEAIRLLQKAADAGIEDAAVYLKSIQV